MRLHVGEGGGGLGRTCAAEPDAAATARMSKLKIGGGRVCWRVSKVARGLPENFTKFKRCPIASSMFPAHSRQSINSCARSGGEYLPSFSG